MMRKKLLTIVGIIAVFAMTGIANSQNLLVNGDFNAPLGTNNWIVWGTETAGWINQEVITPNPSVAGIYDGTLQMSLGSAGNGPRGMYQIVAGIAGDDYTLSLDAGAQDWWWPNGSAYLTFLDVLTNELASYEIDTTASISGFDVGVPYQNFSITETAPAGTTHVKVELAEWAGTGTVWFDNVLLEGFNPVIDTDGDGLPDYWEIDFGLDPYDDGTTNIINGALGDPDIDTLVNSNEFALGTNPQLADTDGDGLADDEEFNTYGTDPAVADSDGDYLNDGAEVTNHFTNPLLADSDSDDVNDATEIYAGSDPNVFASVPANALPDVIGIESFYYLNGAFGPQGGGELFDYDNNVNNDLYTGHTGSSSGWDTTWGTSYVTAGRLETKESGMKRALNGVGTGGQNIALFAQNTLSPEVDSEILYAKVDMTFEDGVSWGGLSLFATGEEEIFFGVSDDGTGTTNSVFKIDESNVSSENSLTTPIAGVTYTMVVAMNAASEVCYLWLDPDLESVEPGADIVKTLILPENLRCDTIRFASGGTGAIFWDNLVVGTTWESLSTSDSDSDSDGLPDAWENYYGLDPLDDGTGSITNGPIGDPDSDTLVNSNEFALGTDPTNDDTDLDGLTDDQELNVASTDPLVWDTDKDGLNDGDEVNIHGTNPLLPDTDSDDEDDWLELFQGTDPNDGASSSASEGIPVVDGTLDAAYGAALATQTVNTVWVDNEDELDAAYAVVKNGRLYMLFAGNMNYNWNKLAIFIDSSDAVTTNVFTAAGNDSSSNMDGLTFDTGFTPDYHVMGRIGGSAAGGFDFNVDFADLSVSNVSWHNTGFDNASGGVAYMGAGDASSNIVALGFINTNDLGVVFDSGGSAANQAAALAVTTGFEISIALSDLGNPSGEIRVMAVAAGEPHTPFSNQLLPGLPAPQTELGDPSTLDFGTIAGDQFFSVAVPFTANPVILSSQLVSGNTLFQLNVSELSVSVAYKVQETDDLTAGFADVPGSDWIAANTNELVTVPADTVANPVMFYQVVSP